MCFYKDSMAKMKDSDNELTVDEYEKISKKIKLINILGISGGEPFLRSDLSEIVKIIYKNTSPLVVDLPTNGYFVDSVLRQTEDIAKYCKDMIIDLQLSIDGPEEIHNEIRGLKDGFSKLKETYKGLIPLKKKYKNLRIKACVVYSHYNQDYMEELFSILNKDFSDFDRMVFSVVHGSVSDEEALQFNWDKYFKICDDLRNTATVSNINDFHSIFTIALRVAKNSLLKKVLQTKDMYRRCKAGKKVIVINEVGKVFPCEPLWCAVGDLRENNYDIGRILRSNEMKEFNKKISSKRCTCHWGLPMSNSLIYDPKYYPSILAEMIRTIRRSKSNRCTSLGDKKCQ